MATDVEAVPVRYEYAALVVAVVDGDTVDLDIDLGLRTFRRDRFRLAGVDAPELRAADPEPGRAAKAELARLLPMGAAVTVRTEKDRTEKYGRWLATVLNGAVNVNERMVTGGFAKPYDGGPRT